MFADFLAGEAAFLGEFVQCRFGNFQVLSQFFNGEDTAA
jgi:hypothetical protein